MSNSADRRSYTSSSTSRDYDYGESSRGKSRKIPFWLLVPAAVLVGAGAYELVTHLPHSGGATTGGTGETAVGATPVLGSATMSESQYDAWMHAVMPGSQLDFDHSYKQLVAAHVNPEVDVSVAMSIQDFNAKSGYIPSQFASTAVHDAFIHSMADAAKNGNTCDQVFESIMPSDQGLNSVGFGDTVGFDIGWVQQNLNDPQPVLGG